MLCWCGVGGGGGVGVVVVVVVVVVVLKFAESLIQFGRCEASYKWLGGSEYLFVAAVHGWGRASARGHVTLPLVMRVTLNPVMHVSINRGCLLY